MISSRRWRRPGARKIYLAYFVDELPPDVNPFVLIEDDYTTIIGDSRYLVKELKDGTFMILRDILNERRGIAGGEKGKEGPGCQPAAFDYNTISHHGDQQYADEETYE